jgi:FixJ family two-component response regulator
MARTKKAVRQEQSGLSIHSVTLAPDVVETLRRLSRDASDFLGWPVSGSAIIRALVRQVDQQADQHGPAAVEALFLQIEQELKSGVRWGKQI